MSNAQDSKIMPPHTRSFSKRETTLVNDSYNAVIPSSRGSRDFRSAINTSPPRSTRRTKYRIENEREQANTDCGPEDPIPDPVKKRRKIRRSELLPEDPIAELYVLMPQQPLDVPMANISSPDTDNVHLEAQTSSMSTSFTGGLADSYIANTSHQSKGKRKRSLRLRDIPSESGMSYFLIAVLFC